MWKLNRIQVLFFLLLNLYCVAFSQQMISVETSEGFVYYPLEDVSITFSDYIASDSIAIATNSATELYALSDIDSISFTTNSSGLEESSGTTRTPGDFVLKPAFPNPFNPETNISVILGAVENLQINVYNLKGQRVLKLAGGTYGPGQHTFNFNAEGLSSGIYFINATNENRASNTQKVVFMK